METVVRRRLLVVHVVVVHVVVVHVVVVHVVVVVVVVPGWFFYHREVGGGSGERLRVLHGLVVGPDERFVGRF